MDIAYLVIHICMFSHGSQEFAFLPMAEMQLLAQAHKNMESQKLDPDKHGIILKLSQNGCEQSEGNIPTFKR